MENNSRKIYLNLTTPVSTLNINGLNTSKGKIVTLDQKDSTIYCLQGTCFRKKNSQKEKGLKKDIPYSY